MNTSGKSSFPGGARRPKGALRENADSNERGQRPSSGRNAPERVHPGQTRKAARFQRSSPPPHHDRPGGNLEAVSTPEQDSGGQAVPRTGAEQAPLLPGIKPVLEMLRSAPERVDAVFLRKGRHGSDMAAIVDVCRAAGVRFSLLDPPSFARVYSGHSQGVVARLFEAGFVDLDELLGGVMDAPLPLVLALDQVQDPGNAGALARTLYALGGAGMIAPRHNGVYLGAAASKAAAGALERLPVTKAANLGQAVDSAKKLGFTIYGAAVAGSPEKIALPGGIPDAARKAALPILPVLDAYSASFRLPALLILGSEESGIRPGLEKRCDYLLSIPMLRDFDSLNVAQAGGIIVSCFARDVLAGRK